jgi:hypothetical protein
MLHSLHDPSRPDGPGDSSAAEEYQVNLTGITATRFSTHADDLGFFTLSDLPAGVYTLEVRQAGFKTLVTGPLTVHAGQALHTPLILELHELARQLRAAR